ncbi:MAG TPA: alpha/beta fold hydrolase [Bacteroidales bacterium]|nr:alpha/beta fold hydrolase [Bacteroidales bacterium]HXK80995.1 alpha/beta fold hydrolase [Bacteroidales bacterium]
MKLHCQQIGSDNKTIIILHGLYGSGDNWMSIAKKFSDNYTVLLPDMRNHGKSPHSDIHNYHVMVEDIRELMAERNIVKAHIIGHSMGGKTAMFFTVKYPELVDKLVIVDIAPSETTKLIEESSHALFHLNLINSLLNIEIDKASNLKEAKDLLANEIDDKRLIGFLLKNTTKSNGKYHWQMNLDAFLHNLPEIMEGLNIDDFIDRKINTSTLFLKGSNSDYIDNKDYKHIDFIFTNSKIKVISGAGHWMHAEQPAAIEESILSFFNE